MPKLEPYSKKLTYSYALGAFPSLALLESRPDRAVRLLLHPDGLENDGVRKLRARCAELGVREEDIPALAVAAFNDVCTGGNPRPTSVEEIERLYHIAY